MRGLMNKQHINIFGVILLFLALVIGCAQNPRPQPKTPEMTDSGLSQAQIERIKKFEMDYGVILYIHDHVIQFGPMGPRPSSTDESWNQKLNALHEAIGDDFTNYTFSYLAL
jgi:hypothetical protein